MGGERFFSESSENSQVKTAIVTKYFNAWAKVMIPVARAKPGRIAYIDLFAGPGRYEDETQSTPLLVLQTAIANPDLAKMLVTVFNDKEAAHTRSLEEEIAKLPGIENLRHKPSVQTEEVGERIVKMFAGMTLVPTLFFVDPWGYKGLSLKLVNSVLKDWGCDCIFFFNYNRINAGLGNPIVKAHMDALFGEERGAVVRKKLEAAVSPADREALILEELAEALRDMGGRYVLPFRFRNERGTRTSHHLIFVSKHMRGYTIMKDIMARESSSRTDGVASFEYSQADARFPLLFNLSKPLDELQEMLLAKFAGKSLSVTKIFEQHNVGFPYIMPNYKEALRLMEHRGVITADPPAAKRRTVKGVVTFADKVIVTFPRRI